MITAVEGRTRFPRRQLLEPNATAPLAAVSIVTGVEGDEEAVGDRAKRWLKAVVKVFRTMSAPDNCSNYLITSTVKLPNDIHVPQPCRLNFHTLNSFIYAF